MLQGSYVALVTPFKKNGIDYNALEKLIDFHLQNGTHGILLNGTTGESPALASDEKDRMVRFCVQRIDGKLPIMLGTGTNSLGNTVSATARAKDYGVQYALVITPYYNKPNQEGLYRFFKEVHDQTDIPIVIYNVPGRTGVNMATETILRLANECPRIIGLKAASADLIKASIVARDTRDDFSVMSGEDALNMPLMACGAKGVISVTANVMPKKVSDMTETCLKGDYATALKLHQELIEINAAMFFDTNPIPVKTALAMMGMIEDEIRLPLAPMDDDKVKRLEKVLKDYKLI